MRVAGALTPSSLPHLAFIVLVPASQPHSSQDYHWHIKLLEEAWDEAHSRNTNVEPPWMSSRWRFHPLKILRNTQTWALAAAKAVAGVRPVAKNDDTAAAITRHIHLITRHITPSSHVTSHDRQVRPFPAVPLLLHGNGVAQQLLKVGYVSATGFQGNTTTARFMQRIFSLHDASRIEVRNRVMFRRPLFASCVGC